MLNLNFLSCSRQFFVALLLSNLFSTILATGKGPIGIYNIDDRYVLVGDSAIDAILAVDLLQGGVVGHFILHNHKQDPKNEEALSAVGGTFKHDDGWRDPIDLASCDMCNFIYMTTTKRASFYKLHLETPLLEMAKNHDFSPLRRSRLIRYCPWSEICSSGNPLEKWKVRMVEVSRDGSMGFIAIYNMYKSKNEKTRGAVFQFNPLENEEDAFFFANKFSLV